MAIKNRKKQPVASLGNNVIHLYIDYTQKETAKAIPGRKWNSKNKSWDFPLRPEILKKLKYSFPNLQVDERIIMEINQIENKEQKITEMKEQGWETAEPEEPMPIKSKPYKHQIQAYNLACKALGVFKDG